MRKNQSRRGSRPQGASRPAGASGRGGDAKRGGKPSYGSKSRTPRSGERSYNSRGGEKTDSDRPRGRGFAGKDKAAGGFSKTGRSYGKDREGATGFDKPRGRGFAGGDRDKPGFDRPKRSYGAAKGRPEKTGERSYGRSRDGEERSDKPRGRGYKTGAGSAGGFSKSPRSFGKDESRRPTRGPGFGRDRKQDDRNEKTSYSKGRPEKAGRFEKTDRPGKTFGGFKKRESDTNEGKPKRRFDKRGAIERSREQKTGEPRTYRNDRDREGFGKGKAPYKARRRKTHDEEETRTVTPRGNEPLRLNKYIANAGICSRREADDYIKSGVVSVNGAVVTELGYKVTYSDVVKFGERNIKPEKPIYILLNKPKDHITTLDDPEGRKTVSDLVKVKERVFPVGRLDRNTTGVLLMTNDGDMAERLMHPKYLVKKVYLATLDKRLSRNDMDALLEGVQLEDGPIAVDAIAYVGDDKKEIGVEIHSGRNRIVHRMFEFLGYKVEKLDRTSYAGITKQNLKKGTWRFLTDEELISLKRLVSLKGKY